MAHLQRYDELKNPLEIQLAPPKGFEVARCPHPTTGNILDWRKDIGLTAERMDARIEPGGTGQNGHTNYLRTENLQEFTASKMF